MGFFKNKDVDSGIDGLNAQMRADEIKRLEKKREELNREIEKLLLRYKRLTGDKRAVLGAKKIGKMKKDYAYWHKY